ncbi:MAG TPA: hypothetical protein VGG65_01945, partial [Thermoanaerobaculia bacterium]
MRGRAPRSRAVGAAGLTLFAAAGAATLGLIRSTGWLATLGGTPRGERLDRMRRSPHWSDGRFRNAMPTSMLRPHDIGATLRMQLFGSEVRYPRRAIPVAARSAADFAAPPTSGLRVTWMGHASALVEIDGRRF